MCVCNPDKCCNGNCRTQEPAFDKNALQASVDLMSTAIDRISTLEYTLKRAHDVIEQMKGAIGKECYRFPSGSSTMTWHSYALEQQGKILKVLSQAK